MEVTVYQYVFPRVKQTGQPETVDTSSFREEEVDDHIISPDPLIIASFLNGLANQYDPQKEGQRSQTSGNMVRITVKDAEKVILDVKSSKLNVVAHMLRGAAKSIIPHGHATRGVE